MTLIVPCFFAHQPLRLRSVEARLLHGSRSPADLESLYFDDVLTRDTFLKAAGDCYFPATRLILDMVRKYADQEKPFRVAYGLSGTLLSQAARFAPDLLDLWKAMADTGSVEFIGGPYHHSLAGLFDNMRVEFREEIVLHQEMVEKLFGHRPSVFCNTDMLYNNAIAACVQDMGFQGILTEGVDWLMAGWRSPDFVYASPSGLPALLRNYRLSEEIGAGLSSQRGEGSVPTAEKYASWLAGNRNPVILLALNSKALDKPRDADTGLFHFLAALPDAVLSYPHLEWATPSQAFRLIPPTGTIDVPDFSTISWTGRARDTSFWLENEMQQFCFEEMKRLEKGVRASGDPHYLNVWRQMLPSDYLYHLSETALSEGDESRYFSAYGTVVEAFSRLHTALYDLKRRVEPFGK